MVVDTHGTDSGMMRWDDEVGEVSRMVNATPTRTSDFIAISGSVPVGVNDRVRVPLGHLFAVPAPESEQLLKKPTNCDGGQKI